MHQGMLLIEPMVWELVTPLIDAEDRAAARLTCKDLAAAIDADSSTAAHSIRVTCWDRKLLHTPRSLQHSIRKLDANINSAQDWRQMQRFLQQLPQLRSLTCTGRRTWPPQMPTGSPAVSPHPNLRAVRFQGFLTSLTELAALAPQLDALSCQTLVLHAQGIGSNAVLTGGAINHNRGDNSSGASKGRNSSSGMSGSGVLPHCKVFAAEAVSIAASDEAEAGQAFAAALPALQVLSDTPAFTWSVPASFRMRRRVLSLQHALSCCSNIRALRTFGSSTALGGLLPQQLQLQGLQQLRTLSVYGVGPAVELLSISKLTRLTALSLTFELPDKRSGKKLVEQVGSLPLLQQLTLPAKLLCGSCCPGATEHLQAMLQHSSGIDPSRSTSSSCSADGSFQQLRQLMFLCRHKADQQRYQCGDYCKHNSPQQLQVLLGQFAEAVRGDMQQQQQQPADCHAAAGIAVAATSHGILRVAPAAHAVASEAAVERKLQLGFAMLPPEPVRLQHWSGGAAVTAAAAYYGNRGSSAGGNDWFL